MLCNECSQVRAVGAAAKDAQKISHGADISELKVEDKQTEIMMYFDSIQVSTSHKDNIRDELKAEYSSCPGLLA